MSFKSYRKLVEFVINLIAKIIPVKKRKFVFESGRSKADDNPRAIFDYIKKNNLKIEAYFIVTQIEEGDGIKSKYLVKRNSCKYFYHMSSSKFWVRSQSLGSIIRKKKNQVYVQTWHGPDLKKMGYDIFNEKHRPRMSHTEEWDLFIANNEEQVINMSNQTGYNGKYFINGMARTDYIVNNKNDVFLKNSLRDKIGVSKHNRVILYAPTLRDWEIGKSDISVKPIEDIYSNLTDNDLLIVRLHPLIKTSESILSMGKNIIDGSDINDLNELLLISDVLITDYSSIFYDYSLLGRPIIFYIHDVEMYIAERGGFYYDHNKELPGVVARNKNELNEIFESGRIWSTNSYKEKYKDFINKYNSYNDGYSSERLLEYLLSKECEGQN